MKRDNSLDDIMDRNSKEKKPGDLCRGDELCDLGSTAKRYAELFPVSLERMWEDILPSQGTECSAPGYYSRVYDAVEIKSAGLPDPYVSADYNFGSIHVDNSVGTLSIYVGDELAVTLSKDGVGLHGEHGAQPISHAFWRAMWQHNPLHDRVNELEAEVRKLKEEK